MRRCLCLQRKGMACLRPPATEEEEEDRRQRAAMGPGRAFSLVLGGALRGAVRAEEWGGGAQSKGRMRFASLRGNRKPN